MGGDNQAEQETIRRSRRKQLGEVEGGNYKWQEEIIKRRRRLYLEVVAEDNQAEYEEIKFFDERRKKKKIFYKHLIQLSSGKMK